MSHMLPLEFSEMQGDLLRFVDPTGVFDGFILVGTRSDPNGSPHTLRFFVEVEELGEK